MTAKKCKSEETSICDRCCAEFFDLTEFLEHKENCTKTPPVLIMNENEGRIPKEDYPVVSPLPLASDQIEGQNQNDVQPAIGTEHLEKDIEEEEEEEEEGVENETEDLCQKSDSDGDLTSTNLSYLSQPKVPNTNTTQEATQSTRTAVNPIISDCIPPPACDSVPTPASSLNAIPMILEQLMCLQQQQLQQIQLTEQIRIQIAMMAPHVLHPSVSAAADPLKALGAHLSQQLSAAAALIGQKAGSQSLALEALKQGKLPHANISVPCAVPVIPGIPPCLPLKPELSRGIPSLSPRFPNPLLPRPPNSVIFQNPLSAVSAATDALRKGKGKPPNISVVEGKPNSEESFFKHKCKFCGKVFGNDSALQIHLRSHTGERPFKCNICGNRFTTKGNLKVHFQRHKERYPHIRMNPYPVPEHLDSVPTSSGIPYGMSLPLEEAALSVVDNNKPVLPVLPTSASCGLPQNLSISSNREPPNGMLSRDSHSIPPPPPRTETGLLFPYSAIKQEFGTDQNAGSPQATGSTCRLLGANETLTEQGSETSKLQQLVENIDKSENDPNECEVCHRVLSCQSSLKMHYRTHTGERPFKFKICCRAFSTKGNLKTHYTVHRANTPLKMQHSCPICQKKFTNAVVLQQHIRMHMGGQIPNTPAPEMDCEVAEADPVLTEEKNDDLSSSFTDDNVDDIEMEGYPELQELSNAPSKPSTPYSESRTASPSIALSIAALENQMKVLNSALNQQQQASIQSGENSSVDSDAQTNDSSSVAEDMDYQNGRSPTMSESASLQALSPVNSQAESSFSKSPGFNGSEDRPGVGTRDCSDSSCTGADPQLDGALDLTSGNLCRKIKEEPGLPFANGDHGGTPAMGNFLRAPAGYIKMEPPAEIRLPTSVPFISPQTVSHGISPQSVTPCISPQTLGHSMTSQTVAHGLSSALVPPPRRPPKQHICTTCGKNFSSASALQIHERTHTGEKPFGCTLCGRAFTTKGNLKVHVGTHMWNNSARRGRRLSIENPAAVLGSDPKKVADMFPKEMVPAPVNLDPSIWNQYAAVLSNGLVMKTNEISVIQNGGIPPLSMNLAGTSVVSASTTSVSKLEGSQSELGKTVTDIEKTAAENVPKQQFPHFMEESKIAVS